MPADIRAQIDQKEKLDCAYNVSRLHRKYNGTQASNQQFYNMYLSRYRHSLLPNQSGDLCTVNSEILKNGTPYCYCDAKTTRRGIANSDSIPFFMRMSQWNFLQTLDESLPYYIARVFLKDEGQIRYMRISWNE